MKKIRINEDVLEQGARGGYGFVESFSKSLEGSPYTRINIVLDVVDAIAFDEGALQERLLSQLSLVRIMTTLKRLADLFDVDASIAEGEWFHVTLAPMPGMPRAWILEADADYAGSVVGTNLVGFERIGDKSESKVPASKTKLDELRAWCKISARAPRTYTLKVPSNLYVRVVDVGHANFAAIHVEPTVASKIVGYFDVGGPVYFHHQTFPKIFNETPLIPTDGFVALSHWDFDHYSLAVTKLKSLQNLTWYAPDQLVGPNAARLQLLLGSRLNLIGAATFQISGGLKMWKGNGPHNDRNNSGYVLTVPNNKGGTLLTGDVSYGSIPGAAKANLVALGVTHHGGSGAGSPPSPVNGIGTAAVSFGLPNRYYHPNWADIEAHKSIGWNVKPTFVNSTLRGDVWLP